MIISSTENYFFLNNTENTNQHTKLDAPDVISDLEVI